MVDRPPIPGLSGELGHRARRNAVRRIAGRRHARGAVVEEQTRPREATRTEAAALSPMGKIPVLRDDGAELTVPEPTPSSTSTASPRPGTG